MFPPSLPNLLHYSENLIAEGFKLFGHDSTYVMIKPEGEEILGLSTERISRFKHDGGSILYFFDPKYLQKTSHIHYSFSTFHTGSKSFFEYLNLAKIRKALKVSEPKPENKNLSKSFLQVFLRYPIFFLRIILERIFHFSELTIKEKVIGHRHHLCHAVGSYYLSLFFGKEALIFVLDGSGDDEFATLWLFSKHTQTLLAESKVNAVFSGSGILGSSNFTSVGWLYSLFTEALGLRIISDEGKTEALAAYGKADEELYKLCQDSYKIDKKKLIWIPDLKFAKRLHDRKFLKKMVEKIGKENFAATIQKFLEDTVVEYLNYVYEKYPIDYLCLSGGVVANVIMNLHIYERTPFKHIYIIPCFGDDGSALGAAILAGLEKGLDLSWLHTQVMPYWGPSYSREEVLEELKKHSDKVVWEDRNNTWPEDAARSILDGKIIAVFQGKMEFGPRALGNRSILADPRDPKIREKMNLSIKRRPYFQPFCPSILETDREELFVKSYPNKHMTMAFRFKEHFRNLFPSACHIDGTARPQFVEQLDNPNYFRLLSEIKKNIGYGIVVNTSFNLHGRAMVMSPDQAMQDFLDCNLDELYIEGYRVMRKISRVPSF